LADALGDRALAVAYAVDGRYLGADGAPVELPDDHERARTAITRDGEVLAVVDHDAALLRGTALEREIGSAARLAVDNERLQAELLGRLTDVRASRARIVAAGDAERRRLERDLHDGAQQRLLAVSYEVRLAIADGDASEEAALEAQHAMDDLRRLAHGIFPAVLGQAGLAAALESLADTAPVAVDIAGTVGERLSPEVEFAAYAVVAESVDDAARRRATSVRVTVRRDDAALVVVVEDDGEPRGDAPVHLTDRTEALGGRLEALGGRLRVELPCG
jgi:signal transduction histidine kinase